jgi:hypothetical protein
MSNHAKMSLKAFWEAVEGRLNACSADELRSILRAMAWETPSLERHAFLQELEHSEEATLAARQAIQQEDLLADIEDLAREIESAMANADAWEEQYQWGEHSAGNVAAELWVLWNPLLRASGFSATPSSAVLSSCCCYWLFSEQLHTGAGNNHENWKRTTNGEWRRCRLVIITSRCKNSVR